MTQKVKSLKEAIDETIKEFEYENNPRIEQLVIYILLHLKRMNNEPDTVTVISKNNGAREYILSSGYEYIIHEITVTTGQEDQNKAILDYAKMYCNNNLEKSKELKKIKRYHYN